MIQANELRIGNWVYEEGEKLTQIVVGWQLDEGMETFGIPITEEWLTSLGFKRHDKYDEIGIITDYTFVYNDEIFIYCDFDFVFDAGFVKKIEFVHDLQNLIFALTNKELILSPPHQLI